jgi:DNA-binding NarL/FixJ family response regulator
MPDSQISARNLGAVICLEGSSKLWRLLKQSLDGEDGPSEFILARSKDLASDILALCRRLAPALLVIEDSRIELLPFKQLRDMLSRRDVQILVFSDNADDASYEGYFRMGCSGVVPYKVTRQMIRKAVIAINSGELWLPRKVLSKVAQEAFVQGNTRKVTQRESEILKLICLGFKNQQIAEHLFISRETVRWHLRSLYSKLGVDGRTAAIRYAKFGNESRDPASERLVSDPSDQ